MGTNGPKFDKEAHYAKQTTNQLNAELDKFEATVSERCNSLGFPHAFFNEHVQYLKLKIAERIINKK